MLVLEMSFWKNWSGGEALLKGKFRFHLFVSGAPKIGPF